MVNQLSRRRTLSPLIEPNLQSAFIGGRRMLMDTTGTESVNTWTAVYGYSRTMTNATKANQPTVTYDGLGGRQIANFDGATQFLSFGATVLTNAQSCLSFLAVVKTTNAAPQRIFSFGTNVAGTTRASFQIGATNTYVWGLRRLDADAATTVTSANNVFVTSAWNIVVGCQSWGDGQCFMWNNGKQVINAASTTAGTTSATNAASWQLGAINGGTFLNGSIAAIYFWQTQVREKDALRLTEWARNIYGVRY